MELPYLRTLQKIQNKDTSYTIQNQIELISFPLSIKCKILKDFIHCVYLLQYHVASKQAGRLSESA